MQGFLLIDKPHGITSFECVKYIRRFLDRSARVGHAGTLDSFATGLLIIAIDRTSTKHIDQIMSLDKRYQAQGKLGQLTDTYDFTGQTLQTDDVAYITQDDVLKGLASFGTFYEQVPPIYSALKHEGQRLSRIARHELESNEELQKIVHEKKRTVRLYNLELTNFELPFFTIDAHVSHGTYIRSLIEDIGQKLNTHATTHALKRTAIGPFLLENAVPLRSITSIEILLSHLQNNATILAKIAKHKP